MLELLHTCYTRLLTMHQQYQSKLTMKATSKFILRNDWKNSNTEHPILLRITLSRTHAYINTAVNIRKSDWNENKQRVRASHPRHAQINVLLEGLSSKFNDVNSEMIVSGSRLTPQEFKLKMQGQNSTYFFPYARHYTAQLRRTGKFSTFEKWESSLNKLEEFFTTVKKNNTPTFSDVNRESIKEYTEWLTVVKGNQPSTVGKSMDVIKRLFHLAMDDESTRVTYEMYPLRNMRFQKGHAPKVHLKAEDIDRLAELELKPGSGLWHSRNMFLFAFFTGGMRISDVLLLTWDRITDGRTKLRYKMKKTGEWHTLPLIGQAATILDLYSDSTLYVFDRIPESVPTPERIHKLIGSRTAKHNYNLKQLAQMAGIDAKVTSHVARHSFADYARKRIKDITIVRDLLGHSSIKVTENYLSSFDQGDMDSYMRDLFR